MFVPVFYFYSNGREEIIPKNPQILTSPKSSSSFSQLLQINQNKKRTNKQTKTDDDWLHFEQVPDYLQYYWWKSDMFSIALHWSWYFEHIWRPTSIKTLVNMFSSSSRAVENVKCTVWGRDLALRLCTVDQPPSALTAVMTPSRGTTSC